jgi:hypothetical protein
MNEEAAEVVDFKPKRSPLPWRSPRYDRVFEQMQGLGKGQSLKLNMVETEGDAATLRNCIRHRIKESRKWRVFHMRKLPDGWYGWLS